MLGLDGFNWGNSPNGLRWTSFADIFRTQYKTLTALEHQAPVWICETASKEPRASDGAPADRRHRKAAWIRGMFDLTHMSRVQAVVWFQSHKERDWRVDSSTGSLRAVRAAVRAR